jgi:hypothetical protein
VEGEILCAGHQQTFSQPFLGMNLPFLRLQNVSVATFYVPRGRPGRDKAVHVAFTGAGIMHIEDPETFHIGASTAGSVVGLVIEGTKVRAHNQADGRIQVQGHIFEPDDPMPGMLTGHVCDEGLARLVGWARDDAED